MKCAKCGAELENGKKFCGECGTPVAENNNCNGDGEKVEKGVLGRIKNIASGIFSLICVVVLALGFMGKFDEVGAKLSERFSFLQGNDTKATLADNTGYYINEETSGTVNDLSKDKASETLGDSVSKEYENFEFQVPIQTVIDHYIEEGYTDVFLLSHEIVPFEGENNSNDSNYGIQDWITLQVTYTDINDLYSYSKYLKCMYVYWGNDIGWKNNYQMEDVTLGPLSRFSTN